MKILEVTNLCKTYGKGDTMVKALDNVSFSVEKGEFLAIIGPSGSGKSTLLHILGGVDVPTSGSVVINQTDISNLPDDPLFAAPPLDPAQQERGRHRKGQHSDHAQGPHGYLHGRRGSKNYLLIR